MNITTISNVWAMMPQHLEALAKLPEQTETHAEITAARQATVQPRNAGKVAILPLYGTITQRPTFLGAVFGDTSTEGFRASFDRAMHDDTVKAIVIEIDSPGGSVAGTDELSRHIYNARGTKPILAVCNSLCASAAYWIGTAADELHITPSGMVGSVGVLAIHENVSAALEKAGIEPTIIVANGSDHKADGNSVEPLSDDARAEIQRQVDYAYEQFVSALARNRGTSKKAVRDNYGKGRVLNAKDAVAVGMADKVLTIDEVLHRASSGRIAQNTRNLRQARASLELMKAQLVRK